MTDRVFVVVCANGRDRDDAQRLGLTIAGVDRVDYLVLRTIEQALRGFTIVGFAFTAWAEHELGNALDVGMLRLALRSRMHPVTPAG